MSLDARQAPYAVWGDHTYSSIDDTAQEDGSVLVIPIGSHEQHGHHLPTATDTILVNEVAHLGATRIGNEVPILLTPPIWAGYSPHHLPFGGTVTVSAQTMTSLVTDIASSALENGFDALLLVNGHGGNKSIVDTLVSEIGTDHPDVNVHGVTYFTLASSFIDEIRESETGGMGHGGELETSLMLHLRPELVEQEKIESTRREQSFTHGSADMFDTGPLTTYGSFDEYSDSGAIGDSTVASAEKGEEIFKRLGDEMATILKEIHDSAK